MRYSITPSMDVTTTKIMRNFYNIILLYDSSDTIFDFLSIFFTILYITFSYSIFLSIFTTISPYSLTNKARSINA